MSFHLSHRNNSGEEHALELLFAELFKKHECRLHTLALRLTKSDNYARDIIQEVFLKLWEHRHHIHTIHNIEAWLYRLTENKVIDFLRKAAADSRLKEAIWKNLPDHFNETEDLVALKEYNAIIQKAIELGARGANSFADNLAKLSNAVSQIVPGGKVNVIGQIGNSQVYGSLVSGIGIAEVNGVTVIVKMANGNPQILGPLP